MPHSALLQAHTMLFLLTSYAVVPRAALVSTYLGSTPPASRPGIELRCQLGHTRQRPGESSCSS